MLRIIRALIVIFAFANLPLAADQNLQPANATSALAACQVVKAKEYLDKYYVCSPNRARADVLQISFGEDGPKVHIFTSRLSWAQHFHSIEHKNCADFQVASGSKQDRQIQKGLKRNLR